MTEKIKEQWMRRCLELAARGAGSVSSNPMVGSVIVDASGELVAEGWHERFGGPHAEVNAILAADETGRSEQLDSSTIFVNLEPCNHHGKTPPCVDLLLERRIRRVVVAMTDPNPQVAGTGLLRLRDAGVAVETGILRDEALRLNEAYVRHVKTGRPLVTVKIAQTLDGRMATPSGNSRWISGEASRRLVHRWRSEMDAVMVGAGTAAIDNPRLTVRHVTGRQPWRIVLDRAGELPDDLNLFGDEFLDRTIVFVGDRASPAYASQLREGGARIVASPEAAGHLNLEALLTKLGRGDDGLPKVQSVLVEAGPRLAGALLSAELLDRLAIFIAPKIAGDGLQPFSGSGIDVMTDAYTFADHRWETIGEDLLFFGFANPISKLLED